MRYLLIKYFCIINFKLLFFINIFYKLITSLYLKCYYHNLILFISLSFLSVYIHLFLLLQDLLLLSWLILLLYFGNEVYVFMRVFLRISFHNVDMELCRHINQLVVGNLIHQRHLCLHRRLLLLS